MNRTITLKVEFTAGASVEECVADMKLIASKLECNITGTFNDKRLTVLTNGLALLDGNKVSAA